MKYIFCSLLKNFKHRLFVLVHQTTTGLSWFNHHKIQNAASNRDKILVKELRIPDLPLKSYSIE